eukprot:1846994-Heterocapsa_arctica.AAC.1
MRVGQNKEMAEEMQIVKIMDRHHVKQNKSKCMLGIRTDYRIADKKESTKVGRHQGQEISHPVDKAKHIDQQELYKARRVDILAVSTGNRIIHKKRESDLQFSGNKANQTD